MRLSARYETRAELAADVESQLGRGGLLVRGDVPRGVEQFAPVELAVQCGDAEVVVPAQVLQFFPGVGVAVSVDAAAREKIATLAAGASTAAPAATAVAAAPAPAPPAPATPSTETAAKGGAAAGMVEKIQRALKGDRETRFAILRDVNRAVHVHVLRNPGLQLDEVAAIARMTTVSVEALAQIAAKREWGHRPEIAIALVRNPTVPVPVAVELLQYVTAADLQQLAKDSRTREPIQRAARKRLLK